MPVAPSRHWGDQSLTLPDGRHLGYAIFGDPDGSPVLNCHGGLLSGRDVAPADETARAIGLCILSPNRPGVGRTDRCPGYDMRSWVRTDLVPLLEHLGIDHFGVMGWSEGGQYALAAAHELAERVTGCAVIAGCPPLDNPVTLKQSNKLDLALTVLARRAPLALRACFAGARALAVYAPGLLLRIAVQGLPADEVAAVTARGRWFPALLGEGSAQPKGVVDEYRAVVAPWGFEPESIVVPVRVFQGTADTSVPEVWGRTLAERIPGASLTLYPGEGHLISLTRRHEVLEWLAALRRRRSCFL